jgi:protein-S-isoprenylcysteine O-methyltransferase Ste14
MSEGKGGFRATETEFRQRFWFIGAIFAAGFGCYYIDPHRAAEGLGVAPRAVLAVGSGLVFAAALLRSWAEAYLHSSIVHDAQLHADRVVADGPYRFVRNPLYLGTILLAVGMGTLASRLGFLMMSIGMTLFALRLVLREEGELLQSQGESYRRYLAAVPRLLPSPWPRLPAGGAHPNWLDGLTGETFMWGFGVALAGYTATGSPTVLWGVMAGSFAAYFLQKRLRRARPG